MIGIDAVDIERLRDAMTRTQGMEDRLFTAGERTYCRSRVDPVLHYAGTLAAKEAVIKAASLGPLVAWGRRIEVRRNASGRPQVKVHGISHDRIDVSISHDGPVAVAVAVAHETKRPSSEVSTVDPLAKPRSNEQLRRYIGMSSSNHWDRSPEQLESGSASVEGTDFP